MRFIEEKYLEPSKADREKRLNTKNKFAINNGFEKQI